MLSEREWDALLSHIRAGKCVPVIGAGAASGVFPLGGAMAQQLADEYRYPFDDPDHLPSVTEFMAVKYGREYPKETVLKRWFSAIQYPDLKAVDEPHSVLAALPLPLYITTNWDDLMVRALELHGKDPCREMCPWNQISKKRQQERPLCGELTPEKPVVFHLHGCDEHAESMVLTETDYVDFLARLTYRFEDLLPQYIRDALASSALLIVGYSLMDVNFRTILRAFAHRPGEDVTHFTIQYPPPQDDEKRQYIEEYFAKSVNVKVIWTTAQSFAAELFRRYKEG